MTSLSSIAIAGGAADPQTNELSRAVWAAARAAGISVHQVIGRAAAERHELVVAIAIPTYYPWLKDVDPRLVVTWFGEPLPHAGWPSLGARLLRGLPSGRLIDLGLALPGTAGGPTSRLRLLRERAAWERETARNLHQLLTWSRPGRHIVVTSRPRAAVLRQHGTAACVVPFGYHPQHAGPLVDPATERDVPVLFLGSLAKIQTRRSRLLRRLAAELAPDVQIAVEPGPISGERRAALIRRARVVVDIQRVPGNFAGLRLILAGAGGAAYVSEPMADPHPFVDGADHLESPFDQLATTIRGLLTDEPRRRAVVRALQARMRDDLAMEISVSRLLLAIGAS